MVVVVLVTPEGKSLSSNNTASGWLEGGFPRDSAGKSAEVGEAGEEMPCAKRRPQHMGEL